MSRAIQGSWRPSEVQTPTISISKVTILETTRFLFQFTIVTASSKHLTELFHENCRSQKPLSYRQFWENISKRPSVFSVTEMLALMH